MNISQILTKLKSLVYSKSEADTLLSSKASSSHKHTKSEITDFPTIPTKTSQLTNDSGFLTSHQSLANYSTLVNTVKSLAISGKTITVTPGSGNAYTLTTQDTVYTHPTTAGNKHIPSGGSANQYLKYSESGTAVWANLPTIPAKTSQLTNDSGYITSSGSCNYANSAGYVQGNNNSANAANALLRSGGGRGDSSPEGDTWIFLDEIGGTSTPWGFKHNQGANTIGFYGRGTETSSINLSNGYFSGSCNYANSAGAVAWNNVSGKPSTYTPSSHTHDDRYYTESEINTLLLSKVYPVGAIYISVNNVNPGTLFGGTWERIKDKFLLSSGDTYSIGSTGGNSSTTLGIANLPSHNHTGTTGNESQGHTHSGTTGNQSANHTHTFSGTTSWKDSHSHTTWTDSQGSHTHFSGHGWHNVEPGSDRQCLSDHYIDDDGWSGNKTSSSGSHGHHIYMDSAGAHDHTYSGTTSGISANHTHSFTTGGVSANHTHSFTTSSVGSTQAFSNMPPYLTVNIWKRTA